MMPRHGYSDLPDHCFWRESIATPGPGEVDPVVDAKFKIGKSDKVATAGFPSYEIITGAHARGGYFAPDLRTVTDAGVRRVMRLFMKHYASSLDTSPPPASASPNDASLRLVDAMEAAARLVCEEEMLGALISTSD